MTWVWWQRGRDYRIPVCCRFRFCVSRGMLGHTGQVARRGLYYGERAVPWEDVWVPCGWFHKKGPR